MKKIIKIIDGIFYHHLKHQEKDFGLTFSGALCAVFSFVGHFFAFLIIIFGLLSNWDAFYNLREFISRSALVYLIIAPYLFWGIYFLFNKRYVSISEKRAVFEQNIYKKLYQIWYWATILLLPPVIFISAYLRFGF